MTKELKMKLAKVFIAFSFVLVFVGIGLDLDNKTLINPVTGTHTIGNSNNDINITTTDATIPSDSSGGENSNSQTNGSTGSSNVGGNGNSATTPSTGERYQSTTESQSGIDATNNDLRNSIQNRYGITVRYGAETNGYTVGGLSSIMLSDANRINELLNSLNYNLSLYPSGFFQETKQGDYSLTIYLLKRYSQENVTGITDSTTKNVVISLATDYSFVESLHHELYHYIEKYMFYRGANYTTWNSLNPVGFNYGKTNTAISYVNTQDPYASFVNTYLKQTNTKIGHLPSNI